MNLFFDIFFCILLKFFEFIMPKYNFKNWQKVLLIIFSQILLISSFACFIAGVYIIDKLEANKVLGIVLTCIGLLLIFVQSILFFILVGFNLKKEVNSKRQQNK